MRRRLLLFIVAFVLRMGMIFLFFGSVDIRCFISMMQCLIDGRLLDFPLWNYFPVIPYYLWLPAFALHNSWGAAPFLIKIIPVLFDTFLVLVLYDYLLGAGRADAFYSALFYAISPVPIIILSLHGQWESLFLYALLVAYLLRDSLGKSIYSYFLYGLFFGYSFLLKPVTLIFLPLFFTPHEHFFKKMPLTRRFVLFTGTLSFLFLVFLFFCIKYYSFSPALYLVGDYYSALTLFVILFVLFVIFLFFFMRDYAQAHRSLKEYTCRQIAAVAGMGTIVLFSFAHFYRYGFNLIFLVETILRYCNQGVQLMGLPFFLEKMGLPGCLLLKNRTLLMLFVLYCAWDYYHYKKETIVYITAIFAFIFSLTGICPQYLMWLLPCMLLLGHWGWAYSYSLLVTLFYFLYYVSPWGNPAMPYQNMLSCAVRKDCFWAAPAQFFLTADCMPLLFILGSFILPMFCFLYLTYLLSTFSFFSRALPEQKKAHLFIYKSPKVFLLYVVMPLAVTFCAYGASMIFDTISVQGVIKKLDTVFDLYAIQFLGTRPIAVYQEHFSIFSLPVLIFFLLVMTTICFILLSRGERHE